MTVTIIKLIAPFILFLLQGKDAAGYSQNSNWQNGPLVFANQHGSQAPSHFQQTMGSAPPSYANMEEQQKTTHVHGSHVQFPSSSQVPQNFRPALNPLPTLEALRVSKIQIPTNPRIATNLALSVPKMDKESSTRDAASTPAYINVSSSNPNRKLSSHDSAESLMKVRFLLFISICILDRRVFTTSLHCGCLAYVFHCHFYYL